MTSAQRVVRIVPRGNFGNRMMQHMVAVTIVNGIGGAVIQGEGLPNWDIPHERSDDTPLDLVLVDPDIDIDAARAVLNRPHGGVVSFAGYGQNIRNFPPVDVARRIFTVPAAHEHLAGFGDGTLVINIRGEEILDAIHPHYTLPPIRFYAELVERTALRPVFLGQIGTGPYFDDLRAAFPRARFVMSEDPMSDFTVLRRSRNIVPAISTFSWLAAWLSHAEHIYLPVCGMLNPRQFADVDLLPLDDPRFSFHLFPLTYAVPADRVRAAHQALSGLWREVPPIFLDALRRTAPRVARSKDAHLVAFDEEAYMRQYPRLAEMIRSGVLPAARRHYETAGYAAHLSPCTFDRVWYASTYPLAALEVTEGDYEDLFHHWLVIGHKRGYQPAPPPPEPV